jgi:hypothetical protein
MRSAEEYRNAAEECQAGEGIAYRAGKSDTPFGTVVELRFQLSCE